MTNCTQLWILRLILLYRKFNIRFYSYSTTNKMHLFLKVFILVKRSTCFGWSFRPSSGAQNCTYGNRHVKLLLLAGTKWNYFHFVPL